MKAALEDPPPVKYHADRPPRLPLGTPELQPDKQHFQLDSVLLQVAGSRR